MSYTVKILKAGITLPNKVTYFVAGQTILLTDAQFNNISADAFNNGVLQNMGYVSDTAPTFSGAYADLTGKPSLFSGAWADLSGRPTIPVAPGDIGAQALNANLSTIAGLDSSMTGMLASDGAGWTRKGYSAVKTALGLTKSDVGLSLVDNTSDAAKPVSTAVSAALAAKADVVGLAAVATAGTYVSLIGRPTLAAMATSGKISDAIDLASSGAAVGGVLTATAISPLAMRISPPAGAYHARNLGMACDAREVSDAAMTAASNVLTSATAAFTAADVGKTVTVARAGSGAASTGQMLVATISSVTDATHAVLSVAATNTVSGKGALIGTDDTAAWTTALAALPHGSTVMLPQGKSLISSDLSIARHITLAGLGANENWGSVVTSTVSLDVPPAPPYFYGSELIQIGAGKNVFTLNAAGITFHARDLVMRWAPGIAFNNTGHGLYAKYGAPALGGSENGIFGSRWDNVAIFGHDGNHYAVYMVNCLYNTFAHIRSYGGGGLHGESDSYYGNYGNSVFNHFQATMFVAGSANCFNLLGRTTGAAGKYNLLQFDRPFAIILNLGAFYDATAGSPTSAQYMFYSNDNVANLTVLAPDFETAVASCTFRFTNQQHWIDPSGLYGSTTFFTAVKANRPNAKVQYSDMTFGGQGPASTATMQSGAGTTPPAAVVSGNDDTRGNITFGTGTSPTTAALIRINWSANKGGVQGFAFAPCNAATAALGLYVVSNDNTGVTLGATTAPAASQANTTYAISYVAIAP